MATGPLTGIKVLDLTSYIAGPFACALLADLGAEVVKVEPPEGDMMRYYPSSLEAESRVFLGVNRGKRSIVLDLKNQDGRLAFLRLADLADVVVENMRPGVMKRLGIDHETLRLRNPQLIHFSLTGYGETGPLRDNAGYDQVLQSMTGIAVCQGAARGEGPHLLQGSVVDFYASSLSALGIVSALFHRARTNTGQRVGVSLLAAALTLQAGRLVKAASEPRDVDRDLHAGKVAGIHPTKEGYIYFQATTMRFWSNLCSLLGVPELANDPRYDTMRKRAACAAELLPKMHAALQARTAIEWEAVLMGHVPCAAVRSINDMFDDEQVLAQGLVAPMEHAGVGSYSGLARPITFEETPLAPLSGAPSLGEHTDAVLATVGYSAEEIVEMRRSAAVR